MKTITILAAFILGFASSPSNGGVNSMKIERHLEILGSSTNMNYSIIKAKHGVRVIADSVDRQFYEVSLALKNINL
jgi:hypothetical protein